jgi:hypothetical protein
LNCYNLCSNGTGFILGKGGYNIDYPSIGAFTKSAGNGRYVPDELT